MNTLTDINEIDIEGMETLNVVSEAELYNRWVFQTIKPFCTGNTLEIGSGIGNISSFFIREDREISLSDLRQNYITILQKKFADHPHVNNIFQMDIVAPDFDSKYSHYFDKFDSIYALNIIEHVEDDLQGIANCKKLLKPGGQLTILVPAYQHLYNTFDEALAHYRRYTKHSLTKLLEANKFDVTYQQYFNITGIFGWWLNGTLLKKKIIPTGQMKLYNYMVPLFKLIDKITFNKIGLSVICVGEKRY